MTTLVPKPIVTRPYPVRQPPKGSAFARLIRTTDAKQIGLLYLVTSFGFFMVGGFMAMLMRAELARPGLQFLSPEQYNQLFTMHGTIMLLLFATPIVFAFANYIVPLQIGAPDVAFPRLNALAYWLYLFGGSLVAGRLRHPGRRGRLRLVRLPAAGEPAELARARRRHVDHGPGALRPGHDPRRGQHHYHDRDAARARHDDVPDADLHLEHPGDLADGADGLPVPGRRAARRRRRTDISARTCTTRSTGGALLWQHLFWFFGHPEVYIVALPFFGIITEIIPVFSRKPIFGYKGMVAATFGIAVLSMSVWAHHMFATGQVLLPFFSFLSYLIAIPTGIKFFNWIGTMWKGQLTFETPMLFAIGFLVTFLLGGLSGVLLASPPIDWHVSDTYFVVAHFHYVLFGTIVFAVYGGIYFWFPKMTGRMLDERLGKVHFWLTFDRLPHHVPGPALARRRGHAPPVRRLPAPTRLASPR